MSRTRYDIALKRPVQPAQAKIVIRHLVENEPMPAHVKAWIDKVAKEIK